jgi:hypothetical protein
MRRRGKGRGMLILFKPQREVKGVRAMSEKAEREIRRQGRGY